MTSEIPESSERGSFITIEGGEGAGKSSQIRLLKTKMEAAGREVVVTREPGGTNGAEIMRHIILSSAAEKFGQPVEAMLFAAARLDHVEEFIRPALDSGQTVLCDRFIDSTRVYQGVVGGVDMDYLHELENVACDGVWPDLTIILDIDPKVGMNRAKKRRGADAEPDRFEKDTIESHQQRRQAFLDIAKQEPDRCVVVAAKGTQKQIAERIWTVVEDRVLNEEPDTIGR